ncbi:DUF5815 family protein [Halobaculum sp. MBLA0147]|uniref:DUF5815 family protein n=1 Tax=Halobaculum sp. MBLA0147 TaxID=3079934 RepID=UPI0035251054
MSEPRVPGGGGDTAELPCGEEIRVREVDMGMREFQCDCGETHAVVTDVHPPDRFLPEFLVETLREAVETTSEEMPEFDTPHLLGIVLEEFPSEVTVADVSEDQDVGYTMLWCSSFDARRLHEVIVELVVELMEHAVSHSDDTTAVTSFEERMLEFDVSEFVDQYREERNVEEEDVYA